jgi:Tripartite tricarboxylate transporter TctB family
MMTQNSSRNQPEQQHVRITSPQNLAAGVLLFVLAAIALFAIRDLRVGTLSAIGPGFVPTLVSVLLAGFGVLLVWRSTNALGAPLEAWTLRGPVCIFGAALAFAATIRGLDVPAFGLKIPALGLFVSGPLAVAVSALADGESRCSEVIALAFGITLLCGALFRFALKLPIPLAPWLIGY